MYWSNNYYWPPPTNSGFTLNEGLIKTKNAYSVCFGKEVNRYTIYSTILLGSHLPNRDAKYFDDNVGVGLPIFVNAGFITDSTHLSTNIIYDTKGLKPLFVLNLVNGRVTNLFASYISWISILTAFLLIIFSYCVLFWQKRSKRYTPYTFIAITLTYWFVIILFLRLFQDSFLSYSEMFSPLIYSSKYIKSLGELLIVTIFFLITIYIYIKKIIEDREIKIKRFYVYLLILECATLVFYFIIFIILKSIVYDSVISIRLNSFNSITVYSFVAVFILLLWSAAFIVLRNALTKRYVDNFKIKQLIIADVLFSVLFLIVFLCFKSYYGAIIVSSMLLLTLLIDCRYVYTRILQNSLYTILILFILHNMLVWFLMVTSDDKQYNQLNIIAHKLAKGERMGYDLLTEESLKQIDQSILADTLLSSYVLNYPNVKNQEIKDWLRKKHFYD